MAVSSFRPFIVYLILILSKNSISQTYQEKLCDVFTPSSVIKSNQGSFTIDTNYIPSGSLWELDWDESVVFNKTLTYQNPNNPNQSFNLRLGKGGQIFSFSNNGFGEVIPPQWRPSFDENGTNTVDPGKSTPIKSHHGNWAPWVDEVWHLVASDQRDEVYENGALKIKTKNMHQAGSYMNNFFHRVSDLTDIPFYSPSVQQIIDTIEGSITGIYWTQSENPSYVYDEFSDCDVCHSEAFKPSLLMYSKITNLGEGVIQFDFILYNWSRTRGVDYWNVPFMGIRNSSLPYAFASNSTTDEKSYRQLNTLPGHPEPSNPNAYLPPFANGEIIKASGRNAESSGWFAFSKNSDGNGPSLALVTAKSSSSPTNGYGDLRYGTAMNNPIRDVTILTRRASGGAKDPITGLKPWGIVAGESIKGRYFIVVDSSIDNIVEQIESRNLISNASIEKVVIDNLPTNNISYNFTNNGNNIYKAFKTDVSNAYITLNSMPFNGSYPVFLISTNSESIITSNPYNYSLKPYDGTVKNIELLGFSSSTIHDEFLTVNSKNIGDKTTNAYPNPTSGRFIIIESNIKMGEVEVYNLFGENITYKVKMTIYGNDKLNIDLMRLMPGLYIVKTKNQDFKVVKY